MNACAHCGVDVRLDRKTKKAHRKMRRQGTEPIILHEDCEVLYLESLLKASRNDEV